MEPERRCKSGMDGGLTAAILVSPLLHLRMDVFLSNRWGPPQTLTSAALAGVLDLLLSQREDWVDPGGSLSWDKGR